MKDIVTTEQMRLAENEYFASGANSLEVMRRAGKAMAKRIASILSTSAGRYKSVLAVCGHGNNGGDGFAAALELACAGYDAHVCFVGDKHKFTDNAAYYYNKCSHLLCGMFEADIILDAIYGTGFHGTMCGDALKAAEYINRLNSLVLAADAPSGLGDGVRADETLCVQAIKAPCSCGSAAQNAGKLTVLDASIPLKGRSARLIEPEDLPDLMPARSDFSHKGTFGSIGIFGGCKGMEGAAMLSAMAAAKTGAGKVTIVSKLPYYAQRPPHILQSDAFTGYDAVAFGMGAGRGARTIGICARLLELECPLVLDADALFNAGELKDGLRRRNERGARTILTPHLKEGARLIGCTVGEIDADPIAAAQEIAEQYHCEVILKSWYSVIVSKETFVLNNPSSALAKAGSGDCLAGICAAVLAFNVPITAAALVHNAAGHKVAARFGAGSSTALDIISSIRAE